MGATELFSLHDTPLNIGRLAASLQDSHAGALVTFEGRVRETNEGREVVALEYEAYPQLSLTEGSAVVREALAASSRHAARIASGASLSEM